MTEETPKKARTIRNPTLDEIEQLKQNKAAQGMTAEELENEEVKEEPVKATKAESVAGTLKPKSSVFEPDSHPFKLISGSMFVKVPNNEIYVRRMGAAEESLFFQLLSNNNMKAINSTMDTVIANCCKTDIDVYELSLVDKLPIFFKIIDLTYGTLEMPLKCNECFKEYPTKINLLKDLKYNYVPSSIKYPHKIRLTSFPKAKIDWYVLYPTIKQSNDYLDSTDIITVLSMMTDRFEGTIVEDGKEREITENDYQEIFKHLNDVDIEAFKDFENQFGKHSVDLTLEKRLCNNSGCSLSGKTIKVDLPVENILERIIRIQNKK